MPKETHKQSEDSDSLSDLSDDEEIFAQYRAARLRELESVHSKTEEKSDLIEELNLDTYVKVADSDGHGKLLIKKIFLDF